VAALSSTNVVLSIASSIPGEAPVVVTLPEVLEIVSNGVAGSSFAEITFLERCGPTVTLATNQVGMGIGAIPYHVSGGPRLDAYCRRAASRVDSTATDDRWPEFCCDAATAGIQSVLSLPLVVSGDDIGVLSFYSRKAFGFKIRDEGVGSLFSSLVSAILERGVQQSDIRFN